MLLLIGLLLMYVGFAIWAIGFCIELAKSIIGSLFGKKNDKIEE